MFPLGTTNLLWFATRCSLGFKFLSHNRLGASGWEETAKEIQFVANSSMTLTSQQIEVQIHVHQQITAVAEILDWFSQKAWHSELGFAVGRVTPQPWCLSTLQIFLICKVSCLGSPSQKQLWRWQYSGGNIPLFFSFRYLKKLFSNYLNSSLLCAWTVITETHPLSRAEVSAIVLRSLWIYFGMYTVRDYNMRRLN